MITQVNPPEIYTILEESEEWVKIQLANNVGWIHQDYFAIIEDQSASDSDELTEEESLSEPKTTEMKDAETNATEITVQTNGISGKRIVIDPGHGGRDVGAIGASEGFESYYTLDTALVMKQVLEDYGAEVYLTRNQDRYNPLTSRVTFANLYQADVFLSVHYNSTPEYPSAQGMDTFYFSERDQQLASYIHEGLIASTDARDRGVTQRDLQVLRTNHRPSLLLELGFLSNETEENRIQSRVYLEAMSRGVVNGLQQYFK
ncbi:N-acetylmuramoyl-L-alanine amidase [Gracilibacillus boraciitolerans JCM 21714]|uniref:N-acetylmuramoyl-L-alanine amidase n=1 Tax=Gracilibacillus boraciitolerans JCM 21714 TaxID=1298598 RepID=W4VN01_9BACI|nr:N-acetylmuramoyl-L-alanine amidase [Gracilibacillus boraciitolerans]GAE94129.1 N-acetylmuramoyl-L-alanine amidase [Gracilibacillus boraciitolerans JCM 21714]